MKAKIARVQLDIDYRCSNCYLHFRLTNAEIPTDKSIGRSCPACNELLEIKPCTLLFADPVASTPQESKDSEDSLRAIKALQSQGYGKKEAQARVRAVYKNTMSVSDLIMEAISYEQPA